MNNYVLLNAYNITIIILVIIYVQVLLVFTVDLPVCHIVHYPCPPPPIPPPPSLISMLKSPKSVVPQ